MNKCRCLRDISKTPHREAFFRKGIQYEYSLEDDVIRVFSDDRSLYFTSGEFDKYFVTVDGWRDLQIDRIISK
jgi:hypothetical protein